MKMLNNSADILKAVCEFLVLDSIHTDEFWKLLETYEDFWKKLPTPVAFANSFHNISGFLNSLNR